MKRPTKKSAICYNFLLVSLFNISDNKPLFNYAIGLKKWGSIILLLNLHRNNSHELLNEDLIKKVKMNDTTAILTLLDIFESEIKKNSYRKLYDEWGNLAAVIYDEDISSQLKVILIDAFKKLKLP